MFEHFVFIIVMLVVGAWSQYEKYVKRNELMLKRFISFVFSILCIYFFSWLSNRVKRMFVRSVEKMVNETTKRVKKAFNQYVQVDACSQFVLIYFFITRSHINVQIQNVFLQFLSIFSLLPSLYLFFSTSLIPFSFEHFLTSGIIMWCWCIFYKCVFNASSFRSISCNFILFDVYFAFAA